MALICETGGGRANFMRSPLLGGAHVRHGCVARPDNRRLRCGDLRAAPVFDALVNGPTRNRTENLLIKREPRNGCEWSLVGRRATRSNSRLLLPTRLPSCILTALFTLSSASQVPSGP